MKINFKLISLLIIILSFFYCGQSRNSYLTIDDKSLSNIVDGIKYEAGNWQHPDYSVPFRSFGNHRFILKTPKTGDAVMAHIPWRRPDNNPAGKKVIVINAENNKIVKDVLVHKINNEFGTIIFKPQNDSDKYYLYYLPHESTGGYYPKLKYLTSSNMKNSIWQQKYKKSNSSVLNKLAKAEIISSQSIDDFSSFFPMEIIATEDEVKKMTQSNSKNFYLFPEYRQYPIRMIKYLPKHWVDRGIKKGIFDKVKKGEFYTFQIGIYSPLKSYKNINITYSDLKSENGSISKSNIHSFNSEGIDLNGKAFRKKLNIEAGKIQALWFGVDIPKNITKGKYSAHFTVNVEDHSSETITLDLDISEKQISNHGDDQPENMSRMRWLNSRIGTDKDFIAKPFIPVVIKNNLLKISGRDIVLGKDGLPEELRSYFPLEMTYLKTDHEAIIGSPIKFQVMGKNKKIEKWRSKPYEIKQAHRSEVNWTVKNESENFFLKVNGCLEYDGTLNYKIDLEAKKSINIDDISLKVPMKQDAAKLMVGLGKKGGKRQDNFSWKWNVKFHQEGVWLGNINKGLQYVLRDNNYERPLNTNFYHNKPLNLPLSWGNKGKGGIRIYKKGNLIIADNYSGNRKIIKGEVLHFNIRFLITPFKTINTKKHFATRFVHKYVPVDQARKMGGTVINVHHANEINPYINYPFYNLKQQKTYIQKAHKKGIKVKLYNTIRELSYKAHELFAMRSLGNEIFNDGKGGGHSWLQEHLRSNYHSAWHATRVNDAAILNKGTSRWTNYYIEGLNWLAKNQKIDGLYLDDIAFGRRTVKRIISVLSKHRDEVIIDLHSANQYNDRDGYINSVFLYMEHLPYVSRLWFGEYFDYNENPDYWLTEVSGIPFGLTGEMLEKGGHPYRGMVFGMTTRVYGKYNPGAIWKLFDDFDIKNSKMLGYWVKDLPIKISENDILASLYIHPDRVLIAIGSWSKKDRHIKLNIDWKTIGFDKNNVLLYSPQISGLQEKKEYDPDKLVKIEKNKGLILILKKTNNN